MRRSLYNLASHGKRLLAGSIDGVIMLLVIIPMIMMETHLAGSVHALRSIKFQFLNFVLGYMVFLLIHGRGLARTGQTLGKKLLKIRIADEQGGVPNLGDIVLIRYMLMGVLCSIGIMGRILGIVDALMIFSDKRQCLHDRFARTIVVDVD